MVFEMPQRVYVAEVQINLNENNKNLCELKRFLSHITTHTRARTQANASRTNRQFLLVLYSATIDGVVSRVLIVSLI